MIVCECIKSDSSRCILFDCFVIVSFHFINKSNLDEVIWTTLTVIKHANHNNNPVDTKHSKFSHLNGLKITSNFCKIGYKLTFKITWQTNSQWAEKYLITPVLLHPLSLSLFLPKRETRKKDSLKSNSNNSYWSKC